MVIVICKYRTTGQTYVAETLTDLDRTDLIIDIKDGVYGGLQQVLEIVDGQSVDVTEKIAQEVWQEYNAANEMPCFEVCVFLNYWKLYTDGFGEPAKSPFYDV